MQPKDILDDEDLLYQLAEEASELAHAALKLARTTRNENPTPITEVEAYVNLTEEFTDVLLVAEQLELNSVPRIKELKLERWMVRLGRGC